MAIEFKCSCGITLRCNQELAGRRTRCKACGKEFVIPTITIINNDFSEVEVVLKTNEAPPQTDEPCYNRRRP
jgi:hypothetical protein